MMHSAPAIAIVGATGAVGRELLAILEQRDVPYRELRLLASPRSAGAALSCKGEAHTIEALDAASFEGIDLALFSAGGSISREFGPAAVRAGAIVIDNSSAFRQDPQCPLIIPEVNGDALDAWLNDGQSPGIIAVPNCSTIIALMAVTPLHRAVGVKRMVVATYQAASGGGAAMMAELEQQARDWAEDKPLTMNILKRQYLFNLFSHNSAVGADGCNEEEAKLLRETRRIWNDDAVGVAATCVRVPVLRAHSEAINLTFANPFSEDEARETLANAPGLEIVDDRAANQFPEPIAASGRDEVLVGRIRADRSQAEGYGLSMFIAGDQLRKGAALNAIQIAERVMAGQLQRA